MLGSGIAERVEQRYKKQQTMITFLRKARDKLAASANATDEDVSMTSDAKRQSKIGRLNDFNNLKNDYPNELKTECLDIGEYAFYDVFNAWKERRYAFVFTKNINEIEDKNKSTAYFYCKTGNANKIFYQLASNNTEHSFEDAQIYNQWLALPAEPNEQPIKDPSLLIDLKHATGDQTKICAPMSFAKRFFGWNKQGVFSSWNYLIVPWALGIAYNVVKLAIIYPLRYADFKFQMAMENTKPMNNEDPSTAYHIALAGHAFFSFPFWVSDTLSATMDSVKEAVGWLNFKKKIAGPLEKIKQKIAHDYAEQNEPICTIIMRNRTKSANTETRYSTIAGYAFYDVFSAWKEKRCKFEFTGDSNTSDHEQKEGTAYFYKKNNKIHYSVKRGSIKTEYALDNTAIQQKFESINTYEEFQANSNLIELIKEATGDTTIIYEPVAFSKKFWGCNKHGKFFDFFKDNGNFRWTGFLDVILIPVYIASHFIKIIFMYPLRYADFKCREAMLMAGHKHGRDSFPCIFWKGAHHWCQGLFIYSRMLFSAGESAEKAWKIHPGLGIASAVISISNGLILLPAITASVLQIIPLVCHGISAAFTKMGWDVGGAALCSAGNSVRGAIQNASNYVANLVGRSTVHEIVHDSEKPSDNPPMNRNIFGIIGGDVTVLKAIGATFRNIFSPKAPEMISHIDVTPIDASYSNMHLSLRMAYECHSSDSSDSSRNLDYEAITDTNGSLSLSSHVDFSGVSTLFGIPESSPTVTSKTSNFALSWLMQKLGLHTYKNIPTQNGRDSENSHTSNRSITSSQ